MAFEGVKMLDIVERAVNHNWSIPVFQRGFVWKSPAVRDLAESLWLDYPIGSLLLWATSDAVVGRGPSDGMNPSIWVVDGQQRTTALCILFARKPYWWSDADGEAWSHLLSRYDVRFDIDATEEPFFRVADATIRRNDSPQYVKLHTLLNLDSKKQEDVRALEKLAEEIKGAGLCKHMSVMEVYTRLDRVRQIREKEVALVTISHDLEDVAEIFARLNSKGTRVTEADIYLGLVASKAPIWVRDVFLPFVRQLAESGFDVGPNLVFRTLTALGAGKVRFKDIDDAFWEKNSVTATFQRVQRGWQNLVIKFREYGVLSDDPLPTLNALVTLVVLLDKYTIQNFDRAIYWLLQATRYQRYSGSSTTALEEDIKDIRESADFGDAISRLMKRLPKVEDITADDFMRDYGDARFGRFILYLMIYRNEARDWDKEGNRIGFEKTELLSGFKPQWHHIFPRKFLAVANIDEEKINALSNIAIIGPTVNIRISAKDPMKYIAKYEISNEKLAQQYVSGSFEVGKDNYELPSVADTPVEKYFEWLEGRSRCLAAKANEFLTQLEAE